MKNKFDIDSYNRKCFLNSLFYFLDVINTILSVDCDCENPVLSFNEFIALTDKIKELSLLVHSLSIKKY